MSLSRNCGTDLPYAQVDQPFDYVFAKPKRKISRLWTPLAALLWTQLAGAHVMLEDKQAPAGSSYTATFRVMHGCDGSPTVQLTVQLPDGISNILPRPKAGWNVATIKKSADATASVVEWNGNQITGADDNAFTIQMKLPATPGKTLYFPVIQECKSGKESWSQIPLNSSDTTHYKLPAPSLQLMPN